jgi:hypothetical protein
MSDPERVNLHQIISQYMATQRLISQYLNDIGSKVQINMAMALLAN